MASEIPVHGNVVLLLLGLCGKAEEHCMNTWWGSKAEHGINMGWSGKAEHGINMGWSGKAEHGMSMCWSGSSPDNKPHAHRQKPSRTGWMPVAYFFQSGPTF